MNKYLSANKRASLLVFAIWVLVFFSILSVGVYRIVSSQITVAKVLEQRLVSLYLAKAAFAFAQIERLADKTPDYDTLYELGQERQMQLAKGKFTYTITDEESKININKAPTEILANLPGLDKELATAMVNSALRPFDLKEEVLLVEGITTDIYNQFKDIVTVYGDGAVNINTAAGDVLRVLGFDDDFIEAIEAYRAGPDFEEGTEDDLAFKKVEDAKVSSFLTDQTLLVSLKSKKLLGTSSKNFSLKINTEILDRPAMSYIIIMEGKKIKRWLEK